MNYTYPQVGAFFENNFCHFTVWAPLKNNVELIVLSEENQIVHSMQKDERGYWSVTIQGLTPPIKYNYQIDGENKFPDPASRFQPDGVHGPSCISDIKFDWSDKEWKGISLGEMIIYELHTGAFTASHNFDGIITKLPYLKDLGINAIELMPVAQFAGARNWGYDGVYPFAVHADYGGPIGLKRLVDAAHQIGIAVILDVVYNHQGPEGNYFSAYAPYFTDKYKTWWGEAINFDDAYCDGVRHYYLQNALMWLDEFHIDGLRLDAVHAIWDFSANHFIEVLTKEVRKLEEVLSVKKVLIAELDLNNPRYINSKEEGGYGMDGQWIDEFHHALHALVTRETNGYYEDFGQIKHLAKAFKDSYVYTGQYSVHRKKHFGALPKNNPYSQFVVFSQNHDQVGNRMLGDRLTTQLTLEALKLCAATVLLSPHVPMLFMGEEYGEKNPFQYFISHTDKELVEMVRKGRREEFSYFNWKGEVPDPQAEETFDQCVLLWNYQDEKAATLLKFYKRLIAFRKERKAMLDMERRSVNVHGKSNDDIIAFERFSGADHIFVILNFSDKPYNVTPLFKGSLKRIFDSSDTEWLGPGSITPSTVTEPFSVNAQAALIFELV